MAQVDISLSKLEEVMWNSETLDKLLESKAIRINELAAGVFAAEERKDNEERTSETSPPSYITSFKTSRVAVTGGKYKWLALNDDPGAIWVEVGAHAGKAKTPVLKLRPFGRALVLLRVR